MNMRVTNGMTISSFLANMQTNTTQMDKYSSQLSSNRRMVRISDDPVGLLNALTARNRLARYEQYKTNLNNAENWVKQCDSSLQELSSKLTNIKENLVSAATDGYNETDKKNVAVLIREFKASVVETLNTSVGNQYIFAGYNTSNAPMTMELGLDGTQTGQVLYNGLNMEDTTEPNYTRLLSEQKQNITMEVGYSLNMDVTLTGLDITGVGDNNMFKVLDDIIEGLESGDPDSVNYLSDKLGDLAKVHDNVTACIVKVGAMMTKVDMLNDRYDEDILNYNSMRSTIEDIDSAETIMNWKTAEAVYKQTLATGARIIQPTLMDFLS